MATHFHLQIADEVTTALNDANWAIEFAAERKLIPRLDFSGMEEGKTYVTVVPGPATFETATRTKDHEAYAVDVALQKRVDVDQTSETDPLLDVTEAIRKWFRGTRLSTTKAYNRRAEHLSGGEAGYSWPDLDQHHVMFAILRLYWEVTR